jgi:hypothetical protein
MNKDINNQSDLTIGTIGTDSLNVDSVHGTGWFTAVCHDAEGNELWRDEFPNALVATGKQFLLDTTLGGSAYTATNYMGLISSVSYSALAVGDTMSSHAGWTEANSTNAPDYTATGGTHNRATCAWSGSTVGSGNATKALSTGLVFTFTAGGTIKGIFVVVGAGSATYTSTAGTLYSAGTFTGGDQVVANTNTITVTYSSTIS